jgi:cohesin complex subunit SA-1/2
MEKSGILYDDIALSENIHVWVATMSSSHSRPFRHTATLIALTLTSTMCSVARAELDTAAKIRLQIKTESSKGGNKARIAQFKRNLTASESKKQFAMDRIKDWFESVYVHRYRDVDPRVRVECVEGMGTWVRTLADEFAEGTYLRYMGWMLSDTFAPVRQEVVKQLYEIMKEQTNHFKMINFIERFRPRLIEIATQDSDPSVRSSGVELAESIREAGMLEPDDIDVIGKLIYDSEPRVRKAVVPFFIAGVEESYEARVLELGGEDELDVLVVDDEDLTAPRKEWIKLKSLAEVLASYDIEDQDEEPSQVDRAADIDFLNVSGAESRFTRAAQVLFESMPEIRDWDMVASYLLFDHSAKASGKKSLRAIKASFRPTEKEEIILLEMLNAVVKMGIAHVDSSEHGRSKKTTKDELAAAKENAARRLANLIPRLLKKFGASPKSATVVLRLEHILNLGVFQDLRQDSTAYAKLLDEISSQFSGHADRNVLSEAGAALLHARSYEELEEVTESKMQSLWDDTISALQTIDKAGDVSVRGSLKESVLMELSHTLARLDKLSSISNSVDALEASLDDGGSLPINILLDIVARGVYETESDLDALEDEVVLSAIRSAMFYFMWKVRSVTEASARGEVISDLDIDQLEEAQGLFDTNLVATLSSRAVLDPVRLFATGTLLDLHVLFVSLRPINNDRLQESIKEIGTEVQAELTSIFDSAEKQFAKQSRKKLAEPGEDEDPEDPEDEGEDEENEEATESERRSATLRAERQLCELTGKLVLAILAKVLDDLPPNKGKLTSRIKRNRTRLGPSFRDVVAYLDEPKSKSKSKGHRSKGQQLADASKNAAKSKEIVEDDEEEDDPFAEEPEEGSAEDLRRRELAEEDDVPMSAAGDDDDAVVAEDEDDDILGD